MCVVELERQTYFKYFSFMRVLKESEGGFAQCKEKALGDTAHLISAKLSRLQQHMEGKGIFFFSPAKVFNLVKPEGLSRCLIIKGV